MRHMDEAGMERTAGGLRPTGPGWFVVNLAQAHGVHVPRAGTYAPLENHSAAPFEDFGINVHVLQPGEAASLYHREPVQEAFLVLAGECLALVEEQERTLRTWDFLHCPAGTLHALVGAGDGPCAILMVGSRRLHEAHYPWSEVAAKHGASAPEDADDGGIAYPAAGWSRERIDTPLPWPLTPG